MSHLPLLAHISRTNIYSDKIQLIQVIYSQSYRQSKLVTHFALFLLFDSNLNFSGFHCFHSHFPSKPPKKSVPRGYTATPCILSFYKTFFIYLEPDLKQEDAE